MLATHLIRVSRWLEAPVRWIGGLLGVLLLLVVAGEFAVVLLRYGWQWSQTWLREGVLALNSAVFLLGAAYALQRFGAYMDVYEKAILVCSVPTFVWMGCNKHFCSA